ncbi:hypothetical protein PIB30_071987, partial [Stylosanthes scabra]|nr:hypothetical protein [Stylosanthes scabra]
KKLARGTKLGNDGKNNKSTKQDSPKKKDQGHHFRCLTKTIAVMFEQCLNRDPQKLALVEEMEFGAFSGLPNYNLKQHMLKELVNIYDIYDNTIHSVRRDVEITTEKIGRVLGLSWTGTFLVHVISFFFRFLITMYFRLTNTFDSGSTFTGEPFDERVNEKELSEEDYAVFKSFQGKSQAELTMLVKRTPVDTKSNRNLFKRAFLIFIQKVFLMATSSPNVTPKALPTLFGLETTKERNWALHVHDFLLDEVKKAKLNKTKAVHGCCYVMMIIYFHETHFGKNPREPEAQPPWIAYWTGENLRKRLLHEQNHSTVSIFSVRLFFLLFVFVSCL